MDETARHRLRLVAPDRVRRGTAAELLPPLWSRFFAPRRLRPREDRRRASGAPAPGVRGRRPRLRRPSRPSRGDGEGMASAERRPVLRSPSRSV